MRAKAGAAILALGCCALPLRAQEQDAYARGSIAWFSSDRLDLLGSVEAELPLAHPGPWRVATFLRAVTAIEKSTSDFTFIVDRVSYRAQFLARRPVGASSQLEVFAGEQGVEMVDHIGRARVRAIGAAWETARYREGFGPLGWSGRIAAGAVVEHSGVEATAVASGSVRYMAGLTEGRHVALGGEAEVDALLGGDGGADLAIGPLLEIDMSGDRRFAVFARWLRSRNPLGIEADGVAAGFDFAQGSGAAGARAVPPEINGLAAAGAGDGGRGTARLLIHVATPPFLSGTTAEVTVDGNVLTADDLNDLFYLYDVGFAHPISSWRAGLWFHHRSNHVLGADNPTITSINVLEAGIESDGWDRAEPSGWSGRLGALDARLRAGWLIDSAFGESVGWHARGGARWASPELGAVRLYLSAEAEGGDVGGSAYAAGTLLPHGWDIRIEARHDEQLFSTDQRAKLLIATLRY